MKDRHYDLAAQAAAHLLNMGHVTSDGSTIELFQKVLNVIYDTMKTAEEERRQDLLTPSRN